MRGRLRAPVVAALALAGFGALGSLRAQEPADLDRVEELIRTGRTEEARERLMVWWDESRSSASRLDAQRGFWLRGILTVDPGQAALDFRRLVLEYPGGRYAAPALFRLAQGAYAAGEPDRARGYVETLARDHPGSPLTREARAWLADAGTPPPPAEPGETETEAVGDTTVAERPEAALPGDEEPPDDDLRYSVQLGAFASAVRARSQMRRAEDAGLDARLVRVQGSRLLHVRVGRFDSSAAANDLLRRVGGLGFVAAVVRDAHREEPYG